MINNDEYQKVINALKIGANDYEAALSIGMKKEEFMKLYDDTEKGKEMRLARWEIIEIALTIIRKAADNGDKQAAYRIIKRLEERIKNARENIGKRSDSQEKEDGKSARTYQTPSWINYKLNDVQQRLVDELGMSRRDASFASRREAKFLLAAKGEKEKCKENLMEGTQEKNQIENMIQN